VAGLSQEFLLSHRFSRNLEPVRVVDDAVHDGVRQRRRGEALMPVRHRDLRGQDRGCPVVAVVDDFQQVLSLDIRERIPQPVIYDQKLRLGQDVEPLRIGTFSVSHSQLLKQPRALKIANRKTVPASGRPQSAGQIGLAGAGRAGDDQIMFVPDPLAFGQAQDLAAIQPPPRPQIQVLGDGALSEVSHPHSADLLPLLTKGPFPIEKQSESLFEGELSILGAVDLLPQAFPHPGELQGR